MTNSPVLNFNAPAKQNAQRLSFDPSAIISALENERFIDVCSLGGNRADHLIYQLRQDSDAQWPFIANGKNPNCPDVEGAPENTLRPADIPLDEPNMLLLDMAEWAMDEGEMQPFPDFWRSVRDLWQRT